MRPATPTLSDDVFRNELRTVTGALTRWAKEFEDVADANIKDAGGFWRISARPRARGACPMTLVVREDQRFDLRLASETFEDLPIDDFALFAALARAVSDGRVELRDVESAATALPKGRETRVELGDGSVWSRFRGPKLTGLLMTGDDDVVRITRFLPYRR